jgi:hypothetical protein
MSHEEIVARWRNPEARRTEGVDALAAEFASPAGEVELPGDLLEARTGGAEEQVTTWVCLTISTGGLASAAISCYPSCGSTLWDGSCNVASYGCCPA